MLARSIVSTLIASVVLLAPGRGVADPDPLYTVTGSAPVTIPADFTDEGIIIHTTIGNRGFDFVLDTGATAITIDPVVTRQLGLTESNHRTIEQGGAVDIADVVVPQMTVGSLHLSNVPALNMQFTDAAAGSRVVGLLGCSFIASGIIGLDFRNKTVTIYPRDTFDPRDVGAKSQAKLDGGTCLARVQASFEGVPGNFILDTGAFTSMVFRRYLDKLPSKGGSFEDQVQNFEGVGGNVRSKTYTLSDFIFGGLHFQGAAMVLPESSTWDVAGYDGVIGRNILSKYAIFLDYQDGLVFFKPEL